MNVQYIKKMLRYSVVFALTFCMFGSIPVAYSDPPVQSSSLYDRLKKKHSQSRKRQSSSSSSSLSSRIKKEIKRSNSRNKTSSSLRDRLKKEHSRKREQPSAAVNRKLFEQKTHLKDKLADQKAPLRKRLSDQNNSLHDRLKDEGTPLAKRLSEYGTPLYDRLKNQNPTLRNRIQDETKRSRERMKRGQGTPLYDRLSQQGTPLYDRLRNPGKIPGVSDGGGGTGGQPSSGQPDVERPRSPNRSQVYQESFDPDNYRERFQSENYRRQYNPYGFPNRRSRIGIGYSYGRSGVQLPGRDLSPRQGRGSSPIPEAPRIEEAPSTPKYDTSGNQLWRMPMPQWMQNVYLTPKAVPPSQVPADSVPSPTLDIEITPNERIKTDQAESSSQPENVNQSSTTESPQDHSTFQTANPNNSSDKRSNQAAPQLQSPNELLISTGDTYFKQRRVDRAYQYYKNASQTDPNDSDIAFRLALCQFADREYPVAGKILRKAYGNQPDIEMMKQVIPEIYSSLVGFRYHLSRLSDYVSKNQDEDAKYLYNTLSKLDL